MSKKPPVFTVEEHDGDQYPDLATAQQHARHLLVADLLAALQALLDSGVLIQENGRIIPNPQKENKK